MTDMNATDMNSMKTNRGESGVFALYTLANSDITWYNSTEHRAQSTEHRAQSTEHRAQSTEHRAQSTEHLLLFLNSFSLSEFSLFTTVDAEGAQLCAPSVTFWRSIPVTRSPQHYNIIKEEP
jgi:hypothetical protein